MLTQERLKELLSYEPETGLFHWLERQMGKRLAGKVAGTIKYGYIQIGIDNKVHLAHRLAFLYVTGSFPDLDTDHIDHDRSNNRWVNLRRVTARENLMNKSKNPKNTSGYNGVYFSQKNKNWVASIRINGRKTHIGSYSCVHKAGEAARLARKAHGYHENHGT